MDLVTLAKAKKYTDDSIEGTSGVLKGKNCTIKSIEKIDGVNTVTFQWTADDGSVKTSTMQVSDGINGVGTDGKSAYQVWLDLGNTGTEEDFLNFLNGFSPTITPNPYNTDDVYKLDITTKDGTFTTPNLRGGDEVTKYTYIGTGNLASETYYSYEDLSTKIGETVEVTVSNRYGESQDTLTIVSKISDTELEVDNGAWIATIMLTNTQTINAKIIDDVKTSTTSTWSSTKIKNKLDNVFNNLTDEQKAELKGDKGDKGDTGATGSKGATGATGATPMIHVNGMGGGERTMAELGPQEGIIAICTNVSGGSFFTSVTDGTVKCNGSSFTSGKTPTAGQSYVIVNSSATASARIYCKNNGGSSWTIIGDVL